MDRIFFGYIALVGVAAVVLLAITPKIQDSAIKPYFWILIAVGLFDGAVYLLGRTATATMLATNARLCP